MDNRTILVMQGPSGTPKDLSEMTTAADAMHGHLAVVNVAAIPPVPTYQMSVLPYGSVGIPDSWIVTQREIADALKVQAEETSAYLAKAGVSSDVTTLCESAHEFEHRIVQHTFMADAAVMMNDLRDAPDAFRSLAYGVIFGSPIPLILNPTAAALTPEKVLVAWNASLPAARALHAALPLLKAAKEVVLYVIDPQTPDPAEAEDPGTGVAAWLSHHGCTVTVQQTPSGGAPIADVILRHATETGADLVVMGAYGHSRLRQQVFGGTTRKMIAQTTQAVLLAH